MSVKKKVEQELDVPCELQRLVFKGSTLAGKMIISVVTFSCQICSMMFWFSVLPSGGKICSHIHKIRKHWVNHKNANNIVKNVSKNNKKAGNTILLSSREKVKN